MIVAGQGPPYGVDTVLKPTYPYYLANEAVFANTDLAVTDKYTGEIATRVALADAKAIDAGIAAAVHAQEAMQAFAPYQRQDVLNHCVMRFKERFEEIALALCIEAGKPIKDSRGEVSRLIDTFRIGAEEAVRIGGEVMNLEIAPRAKGYRGMWKRVPIGPCSLISPFNFPQFGRAQDCSRHCGRLHLGDEARFTHAHRRADYWRSAGRNRPAEGGVFNPALRP